MVNPGKPLVTQVEQLEVEHLEMQSVARADAVVASSNHLLHWVTNEGWALPAASFVLHNMVRNMP
eukprot:9487276-Pyramimonas_sp.AAC.2